MRILIYSYNYHPEPIGIAPLMTELAEGLAARGHDVHVLTGMPNYPQRRIYDGYQGKLYSTEVKNGVTIHRCYVWIRPKPGLVARMLLDASFTVTSFLRAVFGGWRPDVILLTVPPLPVAVPAALLGLINRCPVVLNLQDILPEAAVHVGLIRNKFAIRIFEALERFAYRSAHTISVITDGFVENLRGKGVPQDKMTIIPNWVDVNFIRPLPRDNSFRRAHGLEDKFIAMYSGNIALTQGLETVIDTAERLQDTPDIHFVIVGEEKALQDLRDRCEEKGLTNVLLLPFQPREQLPEMLAAADVGLIVQRQNVISFNMPSKTQVLLASGRPIVASVPNSGTAARAVQRSRAGIVVRPQSPYHLANAILHLYRHPEEAVALGHQGRRHAMECYSFEQAINRYEALFERVTNQHNTAYDWSTVGDSMPFYQAQAKSSWTPTQPNAFVRKSSDSAIADMQ
jgi:colanic acid biosynthesis glycosyl transferase WcaI